MARLKYVEPAELPEDERYLLERPIYLFRALANNREAMKIFRPIGRWIRHDCKLDGRLRELAILQVGYTTNCAYEFSHHVKIAKDFGVGPDDVTALIADSKGEPSELSALELKVLRAAREITLQMSMSDELWDELKAELGTERLMELVMIVSYYNHVVRVLKTFKIDVEPDWAAPLDDYDSPKGPGGWE